jgi:hypothetical protein
MYTGIPEFPDMQCTQLLLVWGFETAAVCMLIPQHTVLSSQSRGASPLNELGCPPSLGQAVPVQV